MLWVGSKYVPPAIDWSTTYRPAIIRIISGEGLFESNGEPTNYNYPPWAIIPLIPLALLPEEVGRVALIFLSILAFLYTAKKLGGTVISIALLLLSPPVIHGLLNGNIDWLVTLGFVLPPQIGLFFVLLKPQIGVALAIYWLVDTWKFQGLKAAIKVFSPFAIVFLISIAVWGFWPLSFTPALDFWWNASFWPYSIPFGIVFLYLAIQRRQKEFSFAASPLLSPYILFHSWVGALLALITKPKAMIIAFVSLWSLIIFRLLSAK
jgi:hypothetical protein